MLWWRTARIGVLLLVLGGAGACSSGGGSVSSGSPAALTDVASVRISVTTWTYWQPHDQLVVMLVNGQVELPVARPAGQDESTAMGCQSRTVTPDEVRAWVGALRAAGVGVRDTWGEPGVTDNVYTTITLATGTQQVSERIYALGVDDANLGQDQRAARAEIASVIDQMTSVTAPAWPFSAVPCSQGQPS